MASLGCSPLKRYKSCDDCVLGARGTVQVVEKDVIVAPVMSSQAAVIQFAASGRPEVLLFVRLVDIRFEMTGVVFG